MHWAERLRTITDLNYGQDDGGLGLDGHDAEWYGIAQYLILDLSKRLALVLRGEIFRDDDGFAVFQFAENDDMIDFQRGDGPTDVRTVGGGDTTYQALTAGLNIRPRANLLIRPEVRWDWADGSDDPFDDSSDDDQFTVGFDVIVTF